MTKHSKHFLFTLMGSTAVFVTLAAQPLEARLQDVEGHTRQSRFRSAPKKSQEPKTLEAGVTAKKTPSITQSRFLRKLRKDLGLGSESRVNPNRTKKHGFLSFMRKKSLAKKEALRNGPQDLLNPIREIESAPGNVNIAKPNLPATDIPAQKDLYDAKADLMSFVKKLRIDDGFSIKNETNENMDLSIKFQSKKSSGFCKKDQISIKPGDVYTADKLDDSYLAGVKLLNNPTDRYLNPKFTPEGLLQLKIEDTQDRHFFHQGYDFDFGSKKFTPEEVEDSSVPEGERSFRRDFNGSCDYMDFMGQQEGVSLGKINQQRQDLYDKNNIGALLKKNPDLLDSTDSKIPLVTHKIWVTSDDAPKDPSPQYIKWLENSIEHNKTTDGWTHYFWVENKEKLPNLTKLLENHKNIKLMELDSLDTTTFVTGDDYKTCIKNKKFGKATDVIRLELLRQYGGFYLDTDYELFQSLKVHAKTYDMIMGLEPMSAYLCNAFIGAGKNHPVVEKSLEMIKRNLSDQAPDYIKNTSDNGFKTIIETGPGLVSAAFALAAGEGDNVDIALPPQMIYPATADVYPKKAVVTPDGKIPAQAFGAHYWNTAWMDPAFGSNG